MKELTIIGIGMSEGTLTRQAVEAAEQAEVLMGAKRMLEVFSYLKKDTASAYTPEQVRLASEGYGKVAVLVSGDTGFYSAADGLCRELTDWKISVVPGISSFSYIFSKIHRPWQDAAIVSCHGRDGNLVDTVRRNRYTFALTGGNVPELGQAMADAGFEDLTVFVGSDLGSEKETVRQMAAKDLIFGEFPSLTVLVVENPWPEANAPYGIPEARFVRGDVPMTKPEVRAISMARMEIRPEDICLDIGAGTGSVTVEMALAAYKGHVYAIDKNEEAVELIKKNCRNFHVGNVTPVLGTVPGDLEQFPAPDVVFVGGSSGSVENIFDWVLSKNPNARIVVNAIVLETMESTHDAFAKHGISCDTVMVQVATAKKIRTMHMMMGGNPVFVISGGREHA